MAYDFASSGYVRVANHADFNNLTAYTYLYWMKPDGLGSFLTFKGTQFSAYRSVSFGTAGKDDLDLFILRATTNMVYTTVGLLDTSGVWQLVACTASEGSPNEGHIYHGNVDTVPTEASYAASTAGTGAFSSDTGGSSGLVVGNRDDFGQPEGAGVIGFFGLWNRVLTLAEIIAQWDHLHVSSGNVVFWLMERAAATAQPDHSGKGHNATAQTGLTYVTNPPIVSPWDDGDYQLSVSAPAAPSGLSIPVAMHNYRRRRTA